MAFRSVTGDPFLDAHRSSTTLPSGAQAVRYVLSRPTPISVRDQVLRGTSLVRRMSENGVIGPAKALLVVGAGAGGASSAMEAARLGVTAYLVDSAALPFSVQARASTRFVDPMQYDWPVDHCHGGQLPAPGQPPLPLTTTANTAERVAVAWRAQLKSARRRHPSLLKVRQPAHLTNLVPVRGAMQGVELSTGERFLTGAVLDAVGFGNEDTRIVSQAGTVLYVGQPFWSKDGFEGLVSGKHHVLISGGGDGALQDYLRVVTRLRRAIDIVMKCRIPAAILNGVQSAEDRANRGLAWVGEDSTYRASHELPFVREREREVLSLVREAIADPDVSAALGALFASVSTPPEVTVVYPGSYLDCYYGLNRFLSLLLSAYLDGGKRRTMHPGCAVAHVAASDGHVCLDGHVPPRAAGTRGRDGHLTSYNCFGRKHSVTFAGDAPARREYNVIIVRHGLVSPPAVALPRPRHLLPYSQP